MWALIHTFLLLVEKFTKNMALNLNNGVRMIVVFGLVLIAWTYFRAENITEANDILLKLFSFDSFEIEVFQTYFDNLFYLALAIIIEFAFYLKTRYATVRMILKKYHLDVGLVTACLLAIIFLRGEGEQFIYFQF
ncbi:MAG: hypothetical protein Mars2KO_13040 [Maribacter sp.]